MFDKDTVAALCGFGAIDPIYKCADCKQEISKKESKRNGGVCDLCAEYGEIK